MFDTINPDYNYFDKSLDNDNSIIPYDILPDISNYSPILNGNDFEDNNSDSISFLNKKRSFPQTPNEEDNDALKESPNLIVSSNYEKKTSEQSSGDSQNIKLKKPYEDNGESVPSKETEKKSSERKSQKDNAWIKTMSFINGNIFQKYQAQIKKHQIHKPNYLIFTHNANLIDDKFYLGLTYKNILQLTYKDYLEVNDLLIKLGLKKKSKLKESFLNKKEVEDAKKLLRLSSIIDEKDKLSYKEVENKLILFLKEKELKPLKEDSLYAKDKHIMKDELIKLKEKTSYNLQKPLDEDIDIKELDMTLKDIILGIYSDKDAHNKLARLLEDIDNKFQKEHKHNSFSLLQKEDNGFIKMINEDCALSGKQLLIINELHEYFIDKALNKENINQYKKLKNLN
jgi:hypothetical protein